ncbi:MAG: TonB-dependent receptor [Bdellovibrionota bacterium]
MRKFGTVEIVAAALFWSALWLAVPPSARSFDGSAFSVSGSNDVSDYAELSLEELTSLQIQVTSATRRSEHLADVPAALFVITDTDIRRTGHKHLPEVLRLAPGLHVARVGSSAWGVSARGFNDRFNSRMLVLMDGRSLYEPTFGGEYWDSIDYPLEDLGRIEVIRGPGGALWGANAVNGIISINTKSAKETQGVSLSIGNGTEERRFGGLRYGGVIGSDLYYRVYTMYQDTDSLRRLGGGDNQDDWQALRTGFRMDWEPAGSDSATVSGDFYYGRLSTENMFVTATPPGSPPTAWRATGPDHQFNINLRWEHEFSSKSILNAQLWYAGMNRETSIDFVERQTVNLDVDHNFSLLDSLDLTYGASVRVTHDEFNMDPTNAFIPNSATDDLYTGFAQFTWKPLGEDLLLIAGTKLERNDYTGFEYQPNARASWTVAEGHTLWGAVSRAVRTPTRVESGLSALQFTAPNLAAPPPGYPCPDPPNSNPCAFIMQGNPDLEAKNLIAYEIGYRAQPVSNATLDVTAFWNHYDDSIVLGSSYTSGPPVVYDGTTFQPYYLSTANSKASSDVFGAEASARWNILPTWSLAGGYSYINFKKLDVVTFLGDRTPRHIFNVRSYLDVTKDLELNAAFYFNGKIKGLGDSATNYTTTIDIPVNARVDVGATWRPTKELEISVWGQNLAYDHRQEYTGGYSYLNAEVQRGVYGQIAWRQ